MSNVPIQYSWPPFNMGMACHSYSEKVSLEVNWQKYATWRGLDYGFTGFYFLSWIWWITSTFEKFAYVKCCRYRIMYIILCKILNSNVLLLCLTEQLRRLTWNWDIMETFQERTRRDMHLNAVYWQFIFWPLLCRTVHNIIYCSNGRYT